MKNDDVYRMFYVSRIFMCVSYEMFMKTISACNL